MEHVRMNKTLGRLGVAAAATAMVVGLSGLPAGAGDISGNIMVTGEATCDTATGTWDIEWTVSNDERIPQLTSTPSGIDFPFLTATIDDAVMSGAATGTVADLIGDSVGPQESTSATVTGIANATGDVMLTVDYSWGEGEQTYSGVAVGDVTLDGSCTPPPTTSAPSTTVEPTTTTAVAADAVAARPTFTG
ncbi:hypothetical protein [Rhabdothermincola salaria]|uniref:hypothetical protein n=1 Tax=Rhabdothermincola salaria TaxID=2903142 RepID=UPI001E64F207|nr:hypothetical protein [Rhabdothermincola salaria]MCD9625616.1 hypothetical protein [Rhabdothermincola salaria]